MVVQPGFSFKKILIVCASVGFLAIGLGCPPPRTPGKLQVYNDGGAASFSSRQVSDASGPYTEATLDFGVENVGQRVLHTLRVKNVGTQSVSNVQITDVDLKNHPRVRAKVDEFKNEYQQGSQRSWSGQLGGLKKKKTDSEGIMKALLDATVKNARIPREVGEKIHAKKPPQLEKGVRVSSKALDPAFEWYTDCPTGGSLGGNQECYIDIYFTPTTDDVYLGGFLDVYSGDGTGDDTLIEIKGEGFDNTPDFPDLVFSEGDAYYNDGDDLDTDIEVSLTDPQFYDSDVNNMEATVNFGYIFPDHEYYREQDLILTNVGNQTANDVEFTIEGDFDFYYYLGADCAFTDVLVGETCTLTVGYEPSYYTDIVIEGFVDIYSTNNIVSPLSVWLMGFGGKK